MGRRSRDWLGHRVGWLIIIVLAGLADFAQVVPLQRLNLMLYDALEPLVRSPGPPPQVAVVAIDERSLHALGAWPWPRSVHAEVIDRLTEAQVAAIGIAILFPETAPGDERLAAALARSGRGVLALAPAGVDGGRAGVSAILPAVELINHAALGHVDVEVDADGLVRRIFRRAGLAGPEWRALAVAVREVAAASSETTTAQAAPGNLPGGRVAPYWVREDELLLPTPERAGSLPTISAFDLLNRSDSIAGLRGKAVFVGTTAIGLAAPLTTPSAGGPMTAVEFHARAYEALRSGQVYQTVQPLFTLLFTVCILAFAPFIQALRNTRSVRMTSLLILVPPMASTAILAAGQFWVPPAAAMIGLAAGMLWSLSLHLKRTRRSLLRARLNADATLHSIAEAVLTVDGNGRVVYLNPVAEQLAGVELGAVRGQTLRDFLAACSDDAQRVSEMLANCRDTCSTVRISEPLSWRSPDGQICALRATLAPIGNGQQGVVLVLNDVTDALAFTSRLEHQATHDPLTGLPNRTLLIDRLRRTLTRSRRSGKMVAVLFVDLDRFKRINDSLGHPTGDHVLKVVADRLANAVRAEDTVARWGGDEFIVLVDGANDRAAITAVATKIHELLEREVASEDDDGLVVSGSIGVSIGPQDSNDADHLLSMADKAMYRVKRTGGDGFAFYSAEMNTWSRERLAVETALRRALVNREFELHYQPQIEVGSGRLVGIESLIRWRQPGLGLIRPEAFIPAAEESGLIRSIGEWVIQEAASQVARWAAEGRQVVPVAVNVSARQCSDMAIVEVIGQALAASRISPASLNIEVTESTAMHNVDFVATLLTSIARLGVAVTVDDFGTGYSSLSCLKRFPISELKIDRSFVAGIAHRSDDAAIVRGTIALAHGMGMTVVAEGVEHEAQLAFLAGHGCDSAQGYHFARPLAADEVRGWMRLATPRTGEGSE